MIDNAVSYYEHLRTQGKPASEALDHAVQRFGVERKQMMDRVNGKVAQHAATMDALAEAKAYLTGEKFWEYDDADELAEVLRRLYNAVTGEGL